jgi:hypothetical protein
MPINICAIPNLGTFAYSHTTFHADKDCRSMPMQKQKYSTWESFLQKKDDFQNNFNYIVACFLLVVYEQD